MWLYFVELVLLVLLAVGVVCYYSEKNIKVYAQLLVFISLATSFVCFMLLPIDIYESVAQD